MLQVPGLICKGRLNLSELDQNPLVNIESLGWNDLVFLKRKTSALIREFTDKIINIDTNRLPQLNQKIYEQKKVLKKFVLKAKQNRLNIQYTNSDLLAISEKISKSKNFLSTMQHRLPQEKQENLLHIIQYNESLINERKYRGIREKDQILSLIKDASMKMDAIKAFLTIKEQLLHFETQCENIKKSFNVLNEENHLYQTEIANCNKTIKALFDSKHQIAQEREGYLQKYNETLLQLDKINARLDMMAEMRKIQHQQYHRAISDDDLLKAKESAKKKLQSGSKLSFDELRLLYNENEL
jgi:uncharacterized coiled-coil DUF342 family protein